VIKLNLLPQYVIEFRRIKLLVIFFVIILALEGGVVGKAYLDLKLQAKWFTDDKPYFEGRKAEITKETAEASTWQGNSTKYIPYLEFFQRGGVEEYNLKIVKVLSEAATQVSGGHNAWFTEMIINGSNVEYRGQIKGLMNFLEFYFHMEDLKLTVKPGGTPAASPAPKDNTLNVTIPLEVTGALPAALPSKPSPPETAKTYTDLYNPYGEAPKASAAAAPGAPAASPGAPAAKGAGAAKK